jgi:hypothetical protein
MKCNVVKFFNLLVIVMFFTACSGVRVLNAERAEGVNLGNYKTFDFFQLEASGDTVTGSFEDRVTRIEDAIAIELQKHGYLLSKTNPDLLINLGLVVDEKTQTRQTDYLTDAPRYIGQRRYSWKSQEVEVSRYRQGTITVDLVDRVQNKQVWQGTVQGVIPRKEENVDAAIKKGVSKLFSKLK